MRAVRAEPNHGLVLEVAFEGLNRSTRHKSGIAMRFPRISRLRWDKPPAEADRLETLEKLLPASEFAPVRVSTSRMGRGCRRRRRARDAVLLAWHDPSSGCSAATFSAMGEGCAGGALVARSPRSN